MYHGGLKLLQFNPNELAIYRDLFHHILGGYVCKE